MSTFLKIATFAVLSAAILTFSEPSSADQSVWVNVGGMSHHFDRSKGYNEDNKGLGVEWQVTEDVTLIGGHYRNSVRQDTDYLGITYQPIRLGDVKIGVSGGAMNGYPNMNKGGGFFAAIPMMSYEYKSVGVNFGVIPNIPNKHVDGAFILQFKLKVF